MILDNTMLIEVSILTSVICISVLVWAYVDSKQEKRLIDAIEAEHRSSNQHQA
jgi:nitrogen fixation-related uncharacterized protein